MRQFLYLDIDKINSIIAQHEKGLIEGVTTEKEDGKSKSNTNKLGIDIKGEAGANILKLAKAEASLNLDTEFEGTKSSQMATKEIIAKTLHDASFDIAYNVISPIVVKYGEDSADPGDYLELNRVFQFVDLDYLEGLFSKGGILEFIKKSEKDKLEMNMDAYIQENTNRDQKRHNGSEFNKAKKEQLSKIDKKYDDIHDIIAAVGKIMPYKHMMVSDDGYLIPVEDRYFRVDPNSIGFMYGGEIKCVGMITNIIGEDTNPHDNSNIFATIQFTVNEALRSILPTNENNLYVVSPLAIYYEN
jgi:hypothetical protein